jgi:hypothetical protein
MNCGGGLGEPVISRSRKRGPPNHSLTDFYRGRVFQFDSELIRTSGEKNTTYENINVNQFSVDTAT